MIKLGELVVTVDSVEKMIKFYTEKLFFDLTDIQFSTNNNETIISSAQLKKGKCYITFKKPCVEELVEFSFIKRCLGRSVGLSISINEKELDQLSNRYQKKGLSLRFSEKSFTFKDPAGIKLMFICEEKNINTSSTISIDKLLHTGISRRVAKKFISLHNKA